MKLICVDQLLIDKDTEKDQMTKDVNEVTKITALEQKLLQKTVEKSESPQKYKYIYF